MKTEIDWKLVAMRIFSAPKVADVITNSGGLPACGLSNDESAAFAAALHSWGWRPTTQSRPAFDLEKYRAWKLEQAKNGFTQTPGEWIDPPYQFYGDIRVAGGTITGAVTAVKGDGLLYDGGKWRNIGPVKGPNIITGPRPGPDTGTHA